MWQLRRIATKYFRSFIIRGWNDPTMKDPDEARKVVGLADKFELIQDESSTSTDRNTKMKSSSYKRKMSDITKKLIDNHFLYKIQREINIP